MKTTHRPFGFALFVVLIVGFVGDVLGDQGARDGAQKAFDERNYKDAFEGFRKLALEPKDEPGKVGGDLEMATQCLERLNRVNEIDAFREGVIEVHKGNWRLLLAAARNYMRVQHQGFMIAGEFQRGQHRGGGKVVNAVQRDRIRALQLMEQALLTGFEGRQSRRSGRLPARTVADPAE